MKKERIITIEKIIEIELKEYRKIIKEEINWLRRTKNNKENKIYNQGIKDAIQVINNF